MPEGKKISEGDFSEGKSYKYSPNPLSTTFNQRWWASPRAKEMLTKSMIDSGMSPAKASIEADKNLAERISDANDTEFMAGGVSGGDFAETTQKNVSGGVKKPIISLSPQALVKDPKSLLTHELAHIGMGGASGMERLTEEDREKYKGNRGELLEKDAGTNEPGELYARGQVIREAALEDKIYDPFSESFTGEHYDKLLEKYGRGIQGKNNPDRRIDNIQQFLRNTSRESAIGLLNTVAQANPAPKAWGASFA